MQSRRYCFRYTNYADKDIQVCNHGDIAFVIRTMLTRTSKYAITEILLSLYELCLQGHPSMQSRRYCFRYTNYADKDIQVCNHGDIAFVIRTMLTRTSKYAITEILLSLYELCWQGHPSMQSRRYCFRYTNYANKDIQVCNHGDIAFVIRTMLIRTSKYAITDVLLSLYELCWQEHPSMQSRRYCFRYTNYADKDIQVCNHGDIAFVIRTMLTRTSKYAITEVLLSLYELCWQGHPSMQSRRYCFRYTNYADKDIQVCNHGDIAFVIWTMLTRTSKYAITEVLLSLYELCWQGHPSMQSRRYCFRYTNYADKDIQVCNHGDIAFVIWTVLTRTSKYAITEILLSLYELCWQGHPSMQSRRYCFRYTNYADKDIQVCNHGDIAFVIRTMLTRTSKYAITEILLSLYELCWQGHPSMQSRRYCFRYTNYADKDIQVCNHGDIAFVIRTMLTRTSKYAITEILLSLYELCWQGHPSMQSRRYCFRYTNYANKDIQVCNHGDIAFVIRTMLIRTSKYAITDVLLSLYELCWQEHPSMQSRRYCFRYTNYADKDIQVCNHGDIAFVIRTMLTRTSKYAITEVLLSLYELCWQGHPSMQSRRYCFRYTNYADKDIQVCNHGDIAFVIWTMLTRTSKYAITEVLLSLYELCWQGHPSMQSRRYCFRYTNYADKDIQVCNHGDIAFVIRTMLTRTSKYAITEILLSLYELCWQGHPSMQSRRYCFRYTNYADKDIQVCNHGDIAFVIRTMLTRTSKYAITEILLSLYELCWQGHPSMQSRRYCFRYTYYADKDIQVCNHGDIAFVIRTMLTRTSKYAITEILLSLYELCWQGHPSMQSRRYCFRYTNYADKDIQVCNHGDIAFVIRTMLTRTSKYAITEILLSLYELCWQGHPSMQSRRYCFRYTNCADKDIQVCNHGGIAFVIRTMLTRTSKYAITEILLSLYELCWQGHPSMQSRRYCFRYTNYADKDIQVCNHGDIAFVIRTMLTRTSKYAITEILLSLYEKCWQGHPSMQSRRYCFRYTNYADKDIQVCNHGDIAFVIRTMLTRTSKYAITEILLSLYELCWQGHPSMQSRRYCFRYTNYADKDIQVCNHGDIAFVIRTMLTRTSKYAITEILLSLYELCLQGHPSMQSRRYCFRYTNYADKDIQVCNHGDIAFVIRTMLTRTSKYAITEILLSLYELCWQGHPSMQSRRYCFRYMNCAYKDIQVCNHGDIAFVIRTMLTRTSKYAITEILLSLYELCWQGHPSMQSRRYCFRYTNYADKDIQVCNHGDIAFVIRTMLTRTSKYAITEILLSLYELCWQGHPSMQSRMYCFRYTNYADKEHPSMQSRRYCFRYTNYADKDIQVCNHGDIAFVIRKMLTRTSKYAITEVLLSLYELCWQGHPSMQSRRYCFRYTNYADKDIQVCNHGDIAFVIRTMLTRTSKYAITEILLSLYELCWQGHPSMQSRRYCFRYTNYADKDIQVCNHGDIAFVIRTMLTRTSKYAITEILLSLYELCWQGHPSMQSRRYCFRYTNYADKDIQVCNHGDIAFVIRTMLTRTSKYAITEILLSLYELCWQGHPSMQSRRYCFRYTNYADKDIQVCNHGDIAFVIRTMLTRTSKYAITEILLSLYELCWQGHPSMQSRRYCFRYTNYADKDIQVCNHGDIAFVIRTMLTRTSKYAITEILLSLYELCWQGHPSMQSRRYCFRYTNYADKDIQVCNHGLSLYGQGHPSMQSRRYCFRYTNYADKDIQVCNHGDIAFVIRTMLTRTSKYAITEILLSLYELCWQGHPSMQSRRYCFRYTNYADKDIQVCNHGDIAFVIRTMLTRTSKYAITEILLSLYELCWQGHPSMQSRRYCFRYTNYADKDIQVCNHGDIAFVIRTMLTRTSKYAITEILLSLYELCWQGHPSMQSRRYCFRYTNYADKDIQVCNHGDIAFVIRTMLTRTSKYAITEILLSLYELCWQGHPSMQSRRYCFRYIWQGHPSMHHGGIAFVIRTMLTRTSKYAITEILLSLYELCWQGHPSMQSRRYCFRYTNYADKDIQVCNHGDIAFVIRTMLTRTSKYAITEILLSLYELCWQGHPSMQSRRYCFRYTNYADKDIQVCNHGDIAFVIRTMLTRTSKYAITDIHIAFVIRTMLTRIQVCNHGDIAFVIRTMLTRTSKYAITEILLSLYELCWQGHPSMQSRRYCFRYTNYARTSKHESMLTRTSKYAITEILLSLYELCELCWQGHPSMQSTEILLSLYELCWRNADKDIQVCKYAITEITEILLSLYELCWQGQGHPSMQSRRYCFRYTNYADKDIQVCNHGDIAFVIRTTCKHAITETLLSSNADKDIQVCNHGDILLSLYELCWQGHPSMQSRRYCFRYTNYADKDIQVCNHGDIAFVIRTMLTRTSKYAITEILLSLYELCWQGHPSMQSRRYCFRYTNYADKDIQVCNHGDIAFVIRTMLTRTSKYAITEILLSLYELCWQGHPSMQSRRYCFRYTNYADKDIQVCNHGDIAFVIRTMLTRTSKYAITEILLSLYELCWQGHPSMQSRRYCFRYTNYADKDIQVCNHGDIAFVIRTMLTRTSKYAITEILLSLYELCWQGHPSMQSRRYCFRYTNYADKDIQVCNHGDIAFVIRTMLTRTSKYAITEILLSLYELCWQGHPSMQSRRYCFRYTNYADKDIQVCNHGDIAFVIRTMLTRTSKYAITEILLSLYELCWQGHPSMQSRRYCFRYTNYADKDIQVCNHGDIAFVIRTMLTRTSKYAITEILLSLYELCWQGHPSMQSRRYCFRYTNYADKDIQVCNHGDIAFVIRTMLTRTSKYAITEILLSLYELCWQGHPSMQSRRYCFRYTNYADKDIQVCNHGGMNKYHMFLIFGSIQVIYHFV